MYLPTQSPYRSAHFVQSNPIEFLGTDEQMEDRRRKVYTYLILSRMSSLASTIESLCI